MTSTLNFTRCDSLPKELTLVVHEILFNEKESKETSIDQLDSNQSQSNEKKVENEENISQSSKDEPGHDELISSGSSDSSSTRHDIKESSEETNSNAE